MSNTRELMKEEFCDNLNDVRLSIELALDDLQSAYDECDTLIGGDEAGLLELDIIDDFSEALRAVDRVVSRLYSYTQNKKPYHDEE